MTTESSAPANQQEEVPKAQRVRTMFSSIAPRYDLLNHLLSLNLDRLWRRAAVRAVAPKPGELVLDACAGTADLSLMLAGSGCRVVSLDFCREMLVLGQEKAARASRPLRFVEADASCLPFPDETFDAATVAFGIRNLTDPATGLRALSDSLKPGGRLAVLEFSQPTGPIFRTAYNFYFRNILPLIGRLVSGQDGPYQYLPESVLAFLEPAELIAILEKHGMLDVTCRPILGGAVILLTANRPTS